MRMPNDQNPKDHSKNVPKWVDPAGLKKAAAPELDLRKNIQPLETRNINTVITGYECGSCRTKFAINQVQKAIKTAARSGALHVECPDCGGFLKEFSTSHVVKPTTSLVQGALKLNDKNTPVARNINTWIDKAIYGRIVQKLGEYIEQFGINNPQLRFQRGLRTAKFLDGSLSARAAEWTVEFTDVSNTRNRIVIQAGVNDHGELIPPKTFKLLSGSEYPLTKLAIDALTGGKLFNAAQPNTPYRPLTHKQRDITDFRVISASTKTADATTQSGASTQTGVGTPAVNPLDPQALNAQLQGLNLDPVDLQTVQQILTRNNFNPGNQLNMVPPTTGTPIGLQSSKLNFKKADLSLNNEELLSSTPAQSNPAIKDAANRGLTFEEAFNDIYAATGKFISQAEWDNTINTLQQETAPAIPPSNDFGQYLNAAEASYKTSLRKTADDAKKILKIDNMPIEIVTATTEAYVNTYNSALDENKPIVEADTLARAAAIDVMNDMIIKVSLRDQKTYVPFTDPNPEHEVYLQTGFSERKFDMPYNETDGGILPDDERGYLTMFKGKKEGTPSLNLKKTGEATGLDLSPEEVGQNPINYSRLKQVVFDLIRAGNIPPTKVDMHALKDGKYSLKELQDLVDTFKAPKDTMYPTSHSASVEDFEKYAVEQKLAEEKLADMFKEMPLEPKKEQPMEVPQEPSNEVGEVSAPVNELTSLEGEVNSLLQDLGTFTQGISTSREEHQVAASLYEDALTIYADLASDLAANPEDELDEETKQRINQLKSVEDLKNLQPVPDLGFKALQKSPQIPEGAEITQTESPAQDALMMEAHIALKEYDRASTSINDSKQLFWGTMNQVSSEHSKLENMIAKLQREGQKIASVNRQQIDSEKAQLLDSLMTRYTAVLEKANEQKVLYQQASQKYTTLYKTMQQIGAKILRSKDYVARIVETMTTVKGATPKAKLEAIQVAAAQVPRINDFIQKVLMDFEKNMLAAGKPELKSVDLKIGPRSQKSSIVSIAMAAETVATLDTLISEVQQLDAVVTDNLVTLQTAAA